MKNLPFAVRGIIVLIVDFVFLWLLLDNKIDGLLTYGVAYLWAIGCGILTHGLLYGVFVGKKAIEATKAQVARGGTSAKKAKGYWIMQGIILLAFVGVTVLKHIELSQMH